MSRIKITPSIIPNMFTSMNMFCGFLSIVYASNKDFMYASWLIILAAIFDTLDGFMARLTKSSSQLGVELDSLSDLVSFGTAPAFLIFSTFLYGYGAVGIIISSLLMIAGGFRLARFNVQLVGFDKSFFKGLPIPSSAITIAGFVIAFYIPGSGYIPGVKSLIIPLVISLAYLMVSTIKYDTIPKPTLSELKEKPYLIVIVALIITSFFVVPINRILFLTFVLIILFGIFRHIFNIITKRR